MLLAVAVLATTTSVAFAADSAIYDLMYLPKAETVYGFSELAYGYGQAALYDESSRETIADVTRSQYSFSQTVGYSLMNNLSLQASMDYGGDTRKLDAKGGATIDDQDSSGNSDLDLLARYRLIDEASKWDLLLGGSFSFADSKSPNGSKDGNLMTGGPTATAGVQFGTLMGGNQFAARLLYTYLFEATDKTAGVKTKSNAHNKVGVDLQWLVGIADQLYLVPRASISFSEKFNDNQGGKTEGLSQFILGAEFRYVVSTDLMVRFGLDYVNFENSVADDIEYREDWFVNATAGVNYQF